MKLSLLLFIGNPHVYWKQSFGPASILLLFTCTGSAAVLPLPPEISKLSLSFVSVMILYLQKPLGAKNLLSYYSELTEPLLNDLVRPD